MRAVGTLAGGIAHDFNNILGAILGFSELLLSREVEGSRPRKHLEQIQRAGTRGKELVKNILVFSRDSAEQRRQVQLHTLLNEALDFFRAAMPSSVELRRDLPATPLFIMADPSQVQRVVINLCSNAAYAMRDTAGKHPPTDSPLPF